MGNVAIFSDRLPIRLYIEAALLLGKGSLRDQWDQLVREGIIRVGGRY